MPSCFLYVYAHVYVCAYVYACVLCVYVCVCMCACALRAACVRVHACAYNVEFEILMGVGDTNWELHIRVRFHILY